MLPSRASLFLLFATHCTFAVTPPPVPASLPAHPRLVLTPSRVAALQAARASGAPDTALFFSQLEAHAAFVLTRAPIPHGVPGPSGILENVRTSLDYLLTSAAAHLLLRGGASDSRFLSRAVLELLNLCVTWTDWNTEQHALDTGEALLATGLAYDWLFSDLNETVRSAIAAGIVSHGLAPYRQHLPNRTVFWWVNNSINWNCVCSSGGAVAVMALFGDAGAPAWAWTDVLQPLVSATGMAPCVAAYNVDSSWEEGPGYFAYASKYDEYHPSPTFRRPVGGAALPYPPLLASLAPHPGTMCGSSPRCSRRWAMPAPRDCWSYPELPVQRASQSGPRVRMRCRWATRLLHQRYSIGLTPARRARTGRPLRSGGARVRGSATPSPRTGRASARARLVPR